MRNDRITPRLSFLAALVALNGCAMEQMEASELVFDPVTLEGGISGPAEDVAVGAVDLSLNTAPCGDQTIATIMDDRGATYAFCSMPDEGAIVFEHRPSREMESYVEGVDVDPVALLDRVTPAGERIPEQVRESVRAGSLVEGQAPFLAISTIGENRLVPLSLGCDDPEAWHENNQNNIFHDFYKEFLRPITNPSWPPSWCVEARTFAHTDFNTSQRTASAYYSGGSCAAKARVSSCGGWTLLKAFSRPGTSGSWGDPVFSFWVKSGGVGVVHTYANSQRSCHPSRDRDDFRFRAESSPGVTHQFGATIISDADTLPTGTCRPDPT